MYNDLDDRRRYDQGTRRPRYEQADDGGEQQYDDGDDQHGQYAEDHQGGYAEPSHGRARYQEDQQFYDDEPERRSRIVPILTIIAAVLILAIGVLAALYFLGVFDSADGPAATVSATTGDTDVPAPPGEADVGPTVRSVTGAATPDIPSDDAAVANPDVPDAVVSIAPPAQGEPPVRSVHEAWQVRCDTPAGAQSEQCVLMQFVTAEDRENVGLTVIVLKTADQKAVIMRILAPLGVLLPSGLGLRIDEADIGKAGFVRCLPNGCVAEVILEDQLLGQLQNGKTATFIIFQTPEEGIGIPISLAGFTPGFAALP
jgi:invasion protein IalB